LTTLQKKNIARHEILKGYIRAAKSSMVNYALLDDRSKKRLDVPFIPSPPPVTRRPFRVGFLMVFEWWG
jgi:hypothetical protein